MTRVANRVRRGIQIARAFVRMGYLLEISYPLAFVMTQAQSLITLFTYYFVARLVPGEGANVAGDYFTFVVIGIVTMRVLTACLNDLSNELDAAIQQGRLEMLLIEPIPWRLLPFGLVQWPLFIATVGGVFMMGLTLPLGAEYHLAGLPMALLITLLGAAASLAIGTVAISVKVLSKRSDPILSVYSLAVRLLAGVFFPVELLPGPLKALSPLLPHTYVIAGNRAVLMQDGGALPGPSPVECIVALIVFSVVMYAISLWLLGRTLNYARRIGVLGGY